MESPGEIRRSALSDLTTVNLRSTAKPLGCTRLPLAFLTPIKSRSLLPQVLGSRLPELSSPFFRRQYSQSHWTREAPIHRLCRYNHPTIKFSTPRTRLKTVLAI